MEKQVYVIAEIGVNHNGSLRLARELIDAAQEAGADAVKLQTFRTDQLVTEKTPLAAYQKAQVQEKDQYEMLKKLELSPEDHLRLKEYCIQRKIQLISSPFDIDSLVFLVNTLSLPIIKIASGELTNGPLLLKAAQSNKKVILSTGMATLGEIEEALGVLAYGYLQNDALPSLVGFKEAYFSEEGQRLLLEKVTLLHCTTAYPAPFQEVHLRALTTLMNCFGLMVGYSDHTQGIALPLAAVALGAQVIEKHLTLDRSLPGPDHRASLEPGEFAEMVKGIRQIQQALGRPHKGPGPTELKNCSLVRKSLVAARPIQTGEAFTAKNLAVKRPGTGMSPMKYWELIGKTAQRAYDENEVIT
ncbi:N-acetylneuraminate synthase [Alkaliphilus crotonatoxidans]